MDRYVVSFFGHRNIDDLRFLDRRIEPILRDIIRRRDFVEFWVGRNGEFDEYVASLIKRVIKTEDKDGAELILVLPYKVADIEYYEKYYDGIFIPDCVSGAYPKGAIKLRNRYMVEQSDLVVVYAQKQGGASYAADYALKKGKRLINIAQIKDRTE